MIDQADLLASIYAKLTGTPGIVAIDFAMANNHKSRLGVVRRAIDLIVSEHVETRQNRQGRSEDELTADVISALKMMGFDAEHDVQIGGHTDISIRGPDEFLWIGEAKIHSSSYDRLLEGFVQLESYFPGTQGKDAGDLLIYLYGRDAASVMTRWRDHLTTKRSDVTVVATDDLMILTEHRHAGSGRMLDFRHKLVPLFWQQMKIAKAA